LKNEDWDDLTICGLRMAKNNEKKPELSPFTLTLETGFNATTYHFPSAKF